MKTSSHFSSRTSALVLGSILIASLGVAGVALAQLNIPTNLSNAAITIQRIFLSAGGVSTNDTVANIILDGINGNITTKPENVLTPGGNLTIGGQLKFTDNDYKCTTGSTGCILKVDESGVVHLVDTFSGASNSGDNNTIFKRTASNPNNIFLAKNDGNVASVGNNASTQTYLRVGAVSADNEVPDKSDTALVVAGRTETRGGILIRRDNDDNTPSNIGTNRNTILENNFTELDIFNQAGKINFKSTYNDPNATATEPTSFLFSAADNITKVGINVPVGQEPDANLHVAGMNDTFLVGNGEGQCVETDASHAWLSSYASRCTNTQTCQDLHGKAAVCTLDTYVIGTSTITTDDTTLFANNATRKVGILTRAPEKELDVVGQVGISKTLHVGGSISIGHTPTYDPGTDKLAVNGNARANAYYYNSDRRYKSDIEVLKSPLANLLKLSGYSYFNKLSEKKDLGVIAQEVEAVYPELVQTDAEGYKSVEYGNLVAPIIEAIKELATKIDHLFTLYVSQQAKIDTLEARLLKFVLYN